MPMAVFMILLVLQYSPTKKKKKFYGLYQSDLEIDNYLQYTVIGSLWVNGWPSPLKFQSCLNCAVVKKNVTWLEDTFRPSVANVNK